MTPRKLQSLAHGLWLLMGLAGCAGDIGDNPDEDVTDDGTHVDGTPSSGTPGSAAFPRSSVLSPATAQQIRARWCFTV